MGITVCQLVFIIVITDARKFITVLIEIKTKTQPELLSKLLIGSPGFEKLRLPAN